MAKIQITSPGIRKALSKYDYSHAISEYIWNGFDAGANSVEISFKANEIGNIDILEISDNGRGIPYQRLPIKFTPFFESEKEIDPDSRRTTSAVHGKNGVGRLTFFRFATNAKWDTVYELNGEQYEYAIIVDNDSLNTYLAQEPIKTTKPAGTKVTFSGIHAITSNNFETDIADFLAREFCWFLELNVDRSYSLLVNGNIFDYSKNVGDKEDIKHSENGYNFNVRYVRWNQSLPREYSRFYFIDSQHQEKFKEYTTLNYKGDQFYHSIYITSEFFDNIASPDPESIDDTYQAALFGHVKGESVFQDLMKFIDEFLRERRKPFLKLYSDKLIADFEEGGAFPDFGENEWDKYRKYELENVIKEIYQIEPKIFASLNVEQKKTIIRLINLIIDTGERDALLVILGEIVDLDPVEREQLSELLKTSTLSGIIKTIKLIEDRVKVTAELKELVFNEELAANERDHIQKAVENHYWLFGEQYHLVTAAEPKFEEALRRYIYLLRGETPRVKIDHPDKQKEMDLFMVRQLVSNTDHELNNVIVELKKPSLRLGEKELSQVKRYLSVVLSQDEFNAKNMSWEFYLVGNKIGGYIDGEVKNAKSHGEKSLVYSVDNYKIYVKTWSEIFTEFELRHNFLLDKLKIERDKLTTISESALKIISDLERNTAKQVPQVTIPKNH